MCVYWLLIVHLYKVVYFWEMGSENPEDFGPAVILAEEDQQEIGGLINSDGEEVDFSDLSEQINCNSKVYTDWLEK